MSVPVGNGLGVSVHVRVGRQLLDVASRPSKPDVAPAEVDVESEDAGEDQGQDGHGDGQPDGQVVGGRGRRLRNRRPVVDFRAGRSGVLGAADGGVIVIVVVVVIVCGKIFNYIRLGFIDNANKHFIT